MTERLDKKKYICNLCDAPVVSYINELTREVVYYHTWAWEARACVEMFNRANPGIPFYSAFRGVPIDEISQQAELVLPCIRHLVVYKI